MLRPNFKSPAVHTDLAIIAIGVFFLSMAVLITFSEPIFLLMLFSYAAGVMFFGGGIVALVQTVRHEHRCEESIRQHNARKGSIKLGMGWR